MTDLISRQAAIAALGERPMVWVESDYELGARNQYDADVLALETVPTAECKGHWINRNGNNIYPFWERYKCSVCGGDSNNSDYCPNCGAKMGAEE